MEGICEKPKKIEQLEFYIEQFMSRLLIDGYNLLYSAYPSGPPGDEEIEAFIELLRRYKKQKSHAITVVFDTYEQGMPLERSERIKGIALIYSRLGEKADQVIERLVRKWGGSCVVVTSDRDLIRSVEKDGAVVIDSIEFIERLRMSEYFELKGDDSPEESEESRIHTRKKGNPKRKSKKERARSRRLRKL
jgi:hypothetical protein